MRKSVWGLISFVSFLALVMTGRAQIITGEQIRGQGTSGTLQSTAVALPKGGFVIKVDNQGESFWLESTAGARIQFPVGGTRVLGVIVPPGTWKAFPVLKPGQVHADVAVYIGNTPPPNTGPVFGSLDQGGMPCGLVELGPQVKTAAYILKTAMPYTIWAAPKQTGQQFFAAAWRPFGPWTLAGRQRYLFHWDGPGLGGNITNDPVLTGTTPILSPVLASLWWQNNTGEGVWLIVNPLPPGCEGSAAGEHGAGIEGIWQEVVSDPDITNSTITITQNGGAVEVKGSFTYKGTPLAFHGTGSVKDNTVEFPVLFDRLYTGWDSRANGRNVCKLSSDGTKLEGTWTNGYGSSGKKQYMKKSTPPKSDDKITPNVAGVWREVIQDPDISNSTITIAQSGNALEVKGSFTYKGTPLTFHGTGTIKSDTVEYSISFDSFYTGWDSRANSRQVYGLSSDGKRLDGTWTNGYGSSGKKAYVKSLQPAP